VRAQGTEAFLTFKGPARFEEGSKIRSEREVGVDGHESVVAILGALGFDVSRRYEKFRETWRLGGVLVCLDHTPIGDFVEFEGSKADQVAKRFRFTPIEAERKNYLGLYEEYRQEHPEAPEDMVFP
jgi:predicted adenylyl cyclase CyaB